MNIKETKTMVLKVADLHPNDGQLEEIGVHANPRIITDDEYRKLVQSLREDNLTGVLQEKVYQYKGEWIVLDGNMRLRALREVGIEDVQCLVVPEDADAKTIEKIIILSNSTFGQWDMDALANWDAPLADWGVDVPTAKEKDNEEILYQEPIQLEPGMEYVLIVCQDADEFEEARKHFGLGFVAEVEGGKKNVKPTRQRVIKFSDYVNSHTEQGQTVQK